MSVTAGVIITERVRTYFTLNTVYNLHCLLCPKVCWPLCCTRVLTLVKGTLTSANWGSLSQSPEHMIPCHSHWLQTRAWFHVIATDFNPWVCLLCMVRCLYPPILRGYPYFCGRQIGCQQGNCSTDESKATRGGMICLTLSSISLDLAIANRQFLFKLHQVAGIHRVNL